MGWFVLPGLSPRILDMDTCVHCSEEGVLNSPPFPYEAQAVTCMVLQLLDFLQSSFFLMCECVCLL